MRDGPHHAVCSGERMKAACAVALVLTLAACGKADNEPGPGGVTVGEARALDEAAEMLDKRRPPPAVFLSTIPGAPEADASQGATPVP